MMNNQEKKENPPRKIASGLKKRIRSFLGNDFFRAQIVFWLLMLSLVANLGIWIFLAVFVKPVDFPIILHYNVYFGVDLLGDWRQAYVLPGVGIVIFIINTFLAWHFYLNKERIASYLLLLAVLMVQLSLWVAAGSLVLINY